MSEITLSNKSQKWFKRIANIAAKRIFRTKEMQKRSNSLDVNNLEFKVLPKNLQKKRISHNNGDNTIMIHPEFFNDRGHLRKKMPRELREELKAVVYKEMANIIFRRANTAFYKTMVRCPWKGSRVDGARGSQTEATKVLLEKKERRKSGPMQEVPTGLYEDVKMFSLSEQKHVLVKNAEIFIGNNKIKIARGTHNGKKVRTMLKGGKELAKQLKLV